MTTDDGRAELLRRLCDYAAKHPPSAPDGLSVSTLLQAYYQHAAYEDLSERSEIDLYGGAAHHLRTGTERPQGTATVRILTPTVSDDGWSADGHTVVEVVTDDMPFLVDSVTMALDEG